MFVAQETMVASLQQFLAAYAQVIQSQSTPIHTRGSECWEVENFVGQLSSEYPITSFTDRKFNLQYAAREFLWYMRGDKFDTSIEKYATIWKKIRATDGGFNSNYGQYIRSSYGLQWVIDTLKKDLFSRQACMVLLKDKHLTADNPDVVCTYSISFRARNNKLNMTVNMRSNDVIYGFTNDVFCFGLIHQMVYNLLKDFYPQLQLGNYTHNVDSMHVYECHFKMICDIVDAGMGGAYTIQTPLMDIEAAKALSVFDYFGSVDGGITWLKSIDNEFLRTLCRWAEHGTN